MIGTDEVGEITVPLRPEAIYGSDGELASHLDRFEERDEQIRMARSVREQLEEGQNLIVEAGTGTGKSLAYLVPLVLFSLETEGTTIVSTHTINLQEQLIQQDLPLVQKMLDQDVTFALGKGRSNYVCRKRLRRAKQKEVELFPEPRHQKELNKLIEWANETDDGTLSDLDWSPDRTVWNRVNASRANCHCTEPDFSEHCFYRESRERFHEADLLVVNHYLFMEDLLLRMQAGTGYLPDYGGVVIDEAHNFERVAQNTLGFSTSMLQHKRLITDLYDPETKSGFLPSIEAGEALDTASSALRTAEQFFDRVRSWHENRTEAGEPVRITNPNFVRNTPTPALERLHDRLRDILMTRDLTSEEEKELSSYAARTLDLAQTVSHLVEQGNEEDVYWVETSDYADNVTIKSSLVDVSQSLSDQLFDRVHSAILTSATLATGSDDPFFFLRDRLGLQEAEALQLGHSFDYDEQVDLYVARDLPHPSYEEDEYLYGVKSYTRKFLLQTRGDAFVLFTSYDMLNAVFRDLKEDLEEEGLTVLAQGNRLPRNEMLNRFRSGDNSVIFGVSSFWEGVDVPGSSLRNVIITKLPFPNPANPIVEAVSEHLENNDRDPFTEFYLPRAILKLRQGFGRLIRSRSDTGQVAILDSRIVQSSYGDQFLEALPDCEVNYVDLDAVSTKKK